MNYKIVASSLTLLVSVVFGAGSLLAQNAADPRTETSRFTPVEDDARRPDFALLDMEGNTRTMDEWDGQVVLVDFWASWCIPCRHEMPYFNELTEKYGDQGFEVIGIAADDRDKVEEFLAEVPVDFPIVYGELFAVMDLSAEYGNSFGGLPFSTFVDRDGNMRYVQKAGEMTYEEAEEVLLRLLN
ncbi:MAG TPA: TlpA disulfide reductase family protein [Gammaproteobacteria bacterium]